MTKTLVIYFAIYLRVSTEEQAESMNGLNAPEDAARAYAARQGWEVIGVFTDAGVTGSAGLEKRPAMLDAIQSLSKGGVSLVAKRDRIGRLEHFAMAMIEAAVCRRGARIISAAGEGTEDDDPASILVRRIIDAFAEYEKLIIRARTKGALGAKRKRSEKTGGPVPYGSDRGPDKQGSNGSIIKTLVPCQAEQEVIGLMRELRAGGMSLETIGSDLEARGIQRREGGVWEHSYISRLLKKTA